MAFNVNDFRSQLVGDGARPNLFQVTLTFPTFTQNGSAAGAKTTFMAKAAQLPGSTIGQITTHYFGREMKFAGNRTFADWTLQIINDEDFVIRNAIESWMNAMNSNVSNIRNSAAAGPSSYTVDAVVDQYSKTGSIIKSYKFVGLFPVDLAPIDLGWDNNDSIEEYSTTFAFQYWESNTTS